MANRERGEASILVDGTAYTLRPSLNAMCEVEDLMGGKRYGALLVEANLGDMRAVRALIWAFLQAKHGDEIKTLADAGKLVDKVGLDEVNRQLEALMQLNAPEEQESGGRPPVGQGGTGGVSTSKPEPALT